MSAFGFQRRIDLVGCLHVRIDILDILETPTNFYLMLAANSGIIVSKSNCTEGLVSFLQEMKAEKLAAQK